MFGSQKCIPDEFDIKDNTLIYNLNSYIEGYQPLGLIPPFIAFENEREFDIYYSQHIFSNDAIFYEFMKIIMSLYYGNNVFIIIGEDETSELVSESLQKLIQARYGVSAYFINEYEDYKYVEDGYMHVNGVYNLDIDKERYVNIEVQRDPSVLNVY